MATTQYKRRITDLYPGYGPQPALAPVPRAPVHVQACVAAAVAETLSLRRRLGAEAFDRDIQAQTLVGFVKGAALGLEMSQAELVELVKPLIPEAEAGLPWSPPC